MDIKKILKVASWPFKKVDEKLGEEIAEKAALATRAALAEAPLLDDLLDGKPVTLHVAPLMIQLKRGE